jgi:hypothetical protein
MHYQFTGELTARDCKRHISHHFALPANSSQIDILLEFAPQQLHGMTNMLTLTLFDPAGFRGAGHRGGNRHLVQINPAAATPGYLPGPLPPGNWNAQIDTHMIMPGETCHYTLTVMTNQGQTTTAPVPAAPAQLPNAPQRGAGWYRGDLHSHTDHSDGHRTVAQLVQTAKDYHLDFIFLTDHNTTSPLPEMLRLASPELLTLGGMELTTFWGHAVCLGAQQWVDWRIRPGSGAMAQIADETYAHEQIFIIAHPMAVGDPACTGCNWRYGEMMPGTARFVEIWNGPWLGDSYNENALALWYDWLNQGLRMIATAGTDTHSSEDYAAQPGFNVLYAPELSQAGIFQALWAGHSYLSAGPQLSLTAHGGTEHWIMGDAVDQPATVTTTWAGCPSDAQLRVIAQGRLLHQQPAGEQGRHHWSITPEQAAWYVVEVRSGQGELLAITNPLFMAGEAV